jgi:hypothetical protein
MAVASGLLVMVAHATYGQSLSNRTELGQAHAQHLVERAVKDTAKLAFHKLLLPTQATAVCVAEPILFGIYGKRNIVKERPYEVYFLGDFWYIAGTLPKGYRGGTFEIIINAKDSRVVFLAHGR